MVEPGVGVVKKDCAIGVVFAGILIDIVEIERLDAYETTIDEFHIGTGDQQTIAIRIAEAALMSGERDVLEGVVQFPAARQVPTTEVVTLAACLKNGFRRILATADDSQGLAVGIFRGSNRFPVVARGEPDRIAVLSSIDRSVDVGPAQVVRCQLMVGHGSGGQAQKACGSQKGLK